MVTRTSTNLNPKLIWSKGNHLLFRSVSFIPSINLTYFNFEWWLDTGANIHVYIDRSWFSSYQGSSGRSVIMDNGTATEVLGSWTINLRFISGKSLILREVQHVPAIRRNLLNSSLLVKLGLKVVLESNKVVISRGDKFIGKGFVTNGLFKLNVMTPANINKSSITFSESTVLNSESYETWHGRLGHVNLRSIKRMSNLMLIPKLDINHNSKCEVCVQSKQPRKPFKLVNFRDSQILELIHSDVCDSNRISTRGGSRYFVTFIDDSSKYCYIYLLKLRMKY